jgi:hypothetical protein
MPPPGKTRGYRTVDEGDDELSDDKEKKRKSGKTWSFGTEVRLDIFYMIAELVDTLTQNKLSCTLKLMGWKL